MPPPNTTRLHVPGSGNRRDVDSIPPVIHRLTASTGDGQRAGLSNVIAPPTVAVAPDGTVYIGEIRKVDPATGIITTFAGKPVRPPSDLLRRHS